jgi:hypothetical protein
VRRRPVLAEDGQELFVRADEKGLVAGLEPGPAPGRVLQQLLVGGAPDGQHPGPRRKVGHGQPVQAAVGRHGQPRHEQRLVAGVERAEHVQAQRRADEPRCGQRGGGPDRGEAEIAPNGTGEG